MLLERSLAVSTVLNRFRPALEAALAAGEILRESFMHEGGPPGRSVSCADADPVAERMIREYLEQAWPDDGYLGEETGYRHAAAGNRRTWVVDPNDGTAAFMQGFRGSAVSIALLEDGVPVFGVVYAHNWPGDEGTFIAWAEGGPVVCNGEEVNHTVPEEITEQVVFVSQAADRKAGANLACVAPRRYFAIPSVAFRLALVAAGFGVAGVSMAMPTAWDLAAGQALLRGAGMDLYDGRGEPVRYDTTGRLRNQISTLVIGGIPEVCSSLLQSDWDSVLRPCCAEDAPWTLERPRAGYVVRDAGKLSRAQGCILGQLCGDALGSQVEFLSADEITRRFPGGVSEIHASRIWNTLAGQPTDDSEMALILARSLLQYGGYSDTQVKEAYRYWSESRPFDMGAAISRGLADEHDQDSQANGALMRVSPLAVFGHALDKARLMDFARQDARITHPHRHCQEVNMLYVRAIATAVDKGPEPFELYEHIRTWARETECSSEVITWVEEARDSKPEDCSPRHAGWVRIAFGNAIWQLLHAPDTETALLDTVSGGGDADTNAAIAGALLGAVHGLHSIPERWRRMVLSCRPLEGFAHILNPRPKGFWPVDALFLAEHLLLAGEEAADNGATLAT